MELQIIDKNFSVCKVKDYSMVSIENEFCFIGKTDEEKSLVCVTEELPENILEKDDGWKAFRINEVLDFSLIGILSKIASILAENKIGIFAVSTFNTDYIFMKRENFKKAILVLQHSGYTIIK